MSGASDLPHPSETGQSAAPDGGPATRDVGVAAPAASVARRTAAIVLGAAAMYAAAEVGRLVATLMPWHDGPVVFLAPDRMGLGPMLVASCAIALVLELALPWLSAIAARVWRRLPGLEAERRQTLFAWGLVAFIFAILWLLFGLATVEGARVVLAIVLVFAAVAMGWLIFVVSLGAGHSLWRGPLGLAVVGFVQGFVVLAP